MSALKLVLLASIVLSCIATRAEIRILATDKACPMFMEASIEIHRVPFPDGWTIVVACNVVHWEMLQRRADALGTRHAFTNLTARLTVVNGQIFVNRTVERPVRRILRHEIGHIKCGCDDELKAEHWALAEE